jgi:hypothetical protein
MSNLKKNSPFKRGESVAGIADWLNYKDIATAGQPASLGSEAVIQLGAIFSQLDFKPKGKASPKKTDSEETDSEDKTPNPGEIFKYQGKLKSPSYTPPPPTLPSLAVDNPRLPDRPTTTVFAGPKITNQNIAPEVREITRDTTGWNRSSESSMAIKPDRKFDEQFSDIQSSNIDLGDINGIINPSGVIDSSTKRLSNETLNALNGLRYTNKDKNDTPLRRVMHAVSSPFLQTDNLNYGQIKQAVMPEYAKGRLGAAAAEGFNLVIDKYNYDQAVKKDYEKELDDEMGDLVVPADFISDTARENYLEFSLGKKKKVAEAFNDYANGRISFPDYKNLKASVESEINQAAATRSNITAAVTDFIKNKGSIDIGASKSEMLDFLLTAEKSPEKISIKTIEGIDYVTGTTRGGEYFQVPTSKIANGTAGFRLVKKASTAPIINGALKAIDQYKEEVKTRYGLGQADADPETAKKIGVNYIKNQLKDETKLRSMMSQIFGVDHTTFQQFVENDETLSAEMLNDAAEELYDMSVAPQYFPQQKTTKVMQPRGGSSTAGERRIAVIKSKLDNLPPPTSGNIDNYMTLLKLNKGEAYQVKGNKLIIGDVKAGTALRTIDLSNPTLAKSQIANLAGVMGYSQGGQSQDLSQYNFDL